MESKKTLVIVESPSKARTIGKYLGSSYKVIASVGSVRDLPKSRLGVDIDNNFEPDYINIKGKGDTIKEIKAGAKAAKKVLLATDPDREGEAISWHICYLLGIDPEDAQRITFQEITKPAIQAAIKSPRQIDMNLVNAQQGRRIIDRVVGFQISPLLWNKVGRGLSAGRVQSAALEILCQREREIKAFVPKEYWVLGAELTKKGLSAAQEKKQSFTARLDSKNGEKISVSNAEEAKRISADLDKGVYSVKAVNTRQESRKPFPPYITSTLMQDASVRLGFSPERTRRTAQSLYEGCDIKGYGRVGLITYIRTDSVRISAEADAACKEFIRDNYSDNYVGNNFFAGKVKNMQDAHEAIRPSNVNMTPSAVMSSLTPDQQKLYELIWKRFVASRMKPAVYDQTSADIVNGEYGFKAAGRKMVFDGYLRVYADAFEDKTKELPALEKGEELKLLGLAMDQKFTEPPSRFTQASLIKELEENGIGRPSTYASIVTTLEERKYVKKEKKALVPTSLGMKITEDVMETYFSEIVDPGFTANMEEALDEVEAGNAEWQAVVSDYYNSYVKDQLAEAREKLERVETEPVYTGENCPECGKPLVIKQSRYGEFIGCSGFPECRFIKPVVVGTGVACPKCGKEIIKKRSKKGKTFYGCSGYPDCDQVFWYKPVNQTCPDCGSILMQKGRSLICSNPDCGYKKSSSSKSKEE